MTALLSWRRSRRRGFAAVLRVAWLLGLLAGVGGRHEGEDEVEGDGAEGGETVDVAKVDFAREEQDESEEEEEDERACEVGIVHEVRIDAPEGVQHGECLDKVSFPQRITSGSAKTNPPLPEYDRN